MLLEWLDSPCTGMPFFSLTLLLTIITEFVFPRVQQLSGNRVGDSFAELESECLADAFCTAGILTARIKGVHTVDSSLDITGHLQSLPALMSFISYEGCGQLHNLNIYSSPFHYSLVLLLREQTLFFLPFVFIVFHTKVTES